MIGDCDLVNSCKFSKIGPSETIWKCQRVLEKIAFFGAVFQGQVWVFIFSTQWVFLRVDFFPSLARAKCHGSFCKHLVLSWLPGVRKQHLNAHLFRNDSVLSLASCYAEEELGAKHPKLLHHAHAVWLKRSKSARPQTAAKLQNCGVDAKPSKIHKMKPAGCVLTTYLHPGVAYQGKKAWQIIAMLNDWHIWCFCMSLHNVVKLNS